MKKVLLGLMVGCIALVITRIGLADTAVPHFLNYQSLLYDDGGNLLANGPADITFKITDASGNVLYEERQTPDIVNGAVSVLIGNGLDGNGAPMGGIPASVLSPGSGRYLDVTVDGYPPESLMEIVSVPYSIYAEKALGAADESINGAALAKKSITIDHLADGVIAELANQMGSAGLIATRTDITNLQTSYRATTAATSIGVGSGFVYSGNNNLQDVLLDMDRAIQTRQAGIDAETTARQTAATTLQTNIDNEATTRTTADTTHAGADISSAHANGLFPILRLDTDIATQAELNSHANTSISSAHSGLFPISRLDTDIATQTELDTETTARSTADTTHANTTSGTHGVGAGQIVGTTLSQTLSNKTYQGSLSGTSGNHSGTWQSNNPSDFASAGHNHDSTYVNTTGDTMGGILDMGSNRVTNLAAPSSASDAARKTDVDAEAAERQGRDGELQHDIDELTDPSIPRVKSRGVVTCSSPPTIQSGNATVSEPVNHVYRVSFTTPMSSSNYAVSLTLQRAAPVWDATGPILVVSDKTINNFDVSGFPAVGNLSSISFNFTVVE